MARRRALAFFVVALSEKKSAAGIGDGVAAFVVPVGPGSSERRQRHRDQRTVDLLQAFIVDAEFFQQAKRGRFDEEIRRSQQPGENLTIRFTLEIEHDAALVGVGVDEWEAPLWVLDVAGERRQPSVGIAARRLDLDHIGAEIGKLPRRVGSGNVAQLDDTQVAECAIVAVYICQLITFLLMPRLLFHHEAHEEHEAFG